MSKIKCSMICAASQNGVIGRDGRMPWSVPSDLKYFRDCTMGHPVIMGRKTWQSIPRPLTGRTNIVITRDKSFKSKSAIICYSKEDAIKAAVSQCEKDKKSQYFVIGGTEIYELFLDICDNIYLTIIMAQLQGDRFFPAFEKLSDWSLKSHQDVEKIPSDDFISQRLVYKRGLN